MENPLVSIIIPAKNAQNTMKKCIDSILNLNYNNYEVIVVNDGSSDETGKVLGSYQNIKTLTTEGVGPSKAKNIAISQARGEFVAFTDADCVVDTNWVVELLKGFLNDNVTGVGGTQMRPNDDSEFGKKVHEFLRTFSFVSDYMKSASLMKPTNHNPSCNVMYRKSVLTREGGFLEGLWPGEDVELDYRIKKRGHLLMFNPKAIVFHYRPNNFRDFHRMMFRYGCAQGRLFKKYGFFRILHLVPLFLVALIFVFLLNVKVGLLITLLVILGLSLRCANSKSYILMFILFFVTMCVWNLGFISGLCKKRL